MRKLGAILLFSMFIISGLTILPKPSQAQPAKWSFMVYMGADSSLEGFGIDDFIEMAAIGSTSDVNIVVQFDRRPGGSSGYGNWDTAKRYLVQKDMTPDAASAISDIGEVNMGDPQILVDFMNWGMLTYPAERYFLVLWGHGLGWQGVVQDASSSSDYLELDELTWAFQEIMANNSGKKIDLVGADACRMTIEMNYQLKDYVEFFVGSQKDEPEPGWPYNTILSNLTNDSDMGPAELGRVVADRYVESYIDNTGLSVALSVIDSARLEQLGEELRRFVEQARGALPIYIEDFKAARLASESYEGNAAYDLHHTLTNIEYEIMDWPLVAGYPNTLYPTRLTEPSISTRHAIYSAVSYERHWDNPVSSIRTPNAHGMSIWYPLGIFNLTYLDLDFCKATGWDDYLLDFKAVADGAVPNPEVVLDVDATLVDVDGDDMNDQVQLELQSPVDATLEIDIIGHGAAWNDPPLSIFLPGNVLITENITLQGKSNYDLELYLLNETRVWMNFTALPFIMGTWLYIRGRILDESGANVTGATVTVENLNNSYEVITESSSMGDYSAMILLTDYYSVNVFQITIEYEDWTMTTTAESWYYYPGLTQNFVLGETLQTDSDQDTMSILLGLIILETVIILVLAVMLWGRKKEPVEKSGEELLKELKLD